MMARRRERGVVLMVALLVLTVLIVIITQMSISSAHNKTISTNYLDDLQNSYAVKSAYYHATLYLKGDLETEPKVDSLEERWAQPISLKVGESDATAQVVDESSKINLSFLVKQDGKLDPNVHDMFVRLVRVLQHRDDIVDRVIEYIDPNSEGEFKAGAKNAPLYTADELTAVRGIKLEEVYGGKIDEVEKKGLIDFVTVWPKREQGSTENDWKINVNTASVEVLTALSDKMTPQIAAEIVAYRSRPRDGQPGHFKTIVDLKNVAGVTDLVYQSIQSRVKVASSVYSIEAHGRSGNLEKAWLYIVKRDQVKKTVNFVASYRLSRNISIPPK